MTHPTPRQLADYGLGRLPPRELSAVHQHISVCAECRRTVENQPPDSFIAQLKSATPKGGTVLAGPPPEEKTTPPGETAVHEGKPGAQGQSIDDVPAELLSSSKFAILGKLGAGGMGAVYKAKHNFLGETVAIKVVKPDVVSHPEVRQRFLREMQSAGQLKHPNIVRALDAEQIGDLLVLVMEYVAGITLDRLVAQRGPLPIDFACRCIIQAAMGLQHAHEKGLVHRDVKPGNLMVSPKDQEVKLLDFGLARAAGAQVDRYIQTRLQTFMGTPEYVAPEQATDARAADIRADVYSLGCTLYYLLAGRPPFSGKTPVETVVAQIENDPRPLPEIRPEVPAALWSVLAKMLAKKPSDRYQTPIEVYRALQPFAEPGRRGQPAPPPPAPLAAPSDTAPALPIPPRVRKSKKRVVPSAWRLGAAAAVVAALALAAWLVLSGLKAKKEVAEQPKDNPAGPAPDNTLPSPPPLAEKITNSIGMSFVRIAPGPFRMGSPPAERGRGDDELLHDVEITRPFWLGVHPVTQKQYQAIMGSNPSAFRSDDFPVETVLWTDAEQFCRKLSVRVEEKEAGRAYRLPTEAEWEYACRAGTTTPFTTGADLAGHVANFGSPDGGTCKVGSYPPNRWGLYDMHGNVWQWCGDWYDADYYRNSPRKDPPGPARGAERVLRGGSWYSKERDCRAANRYQAAPEEKFDNAGFRVVCVPGSGAP